MTSVGSRLGTPASYKDTTRTLDPSSSNLALDTGRGVGLIEVLNSIIQSTSAMGTFFKSISPQGSSQNENTTLLLQQSGFVTKGLTQKQIQTLGDGLKKELMNGRFVQRAQTIQNSNQTMTRDQVGSTALREAFKATASGNGIRLQANNILPLTQQQKNPPSMCIADHEINYSPNGKDYWVRSKGFLRNVEGIDPFADVTVTVTGEVAGKPVKAPGISSGKGFVTVPDSDNAYHSLPMRPRLEIETTAECVKNGVTTKGKKVFQAP